MRDRSASASYQVHKAEGRRPCHSQSDLWAQVSTLPITVHLCVHLGALGNCTKTIKNQARPSPPQTHVFAWSFQSDAGLSCHWEEKPFHRLCAAHLKANSIGNTTVSQEETRGGACPGLSETSNRQANTAFQRPSLPRVNRS